MPPSAVGGVAQAWYKDDIRDTKYSGEGGIVNGPGLRILSGVPPDGDLPAKIVPLRCAAVLLNLFLTPHHHTTTITV